MFASTAVVDPQGRVLLQERDAHAPAAGDDWGLPGAGLAPGETGLEAAVRGLEGVGTDVPAGDLHSLGRTSFHCDPCGGVDTYELFAAYADLTGARFLRPEDAFARPLCPAASMQLPDLLDSADHRDRFGGVPGRRFACVGLVARSGALLMQERDEHPVLDPDRWGLPGGHLEEGESFLDGALRELAEETGVTLARDELTLVGEARVDHTDVYGTHDRVRFFVAATDLGDADVECREGRRMVFVDAATVAGLPLTRSATTVLPGFLRSGLYATLAP